MRQYAPPAPRPALPHRYPYRPRPPAKTPLGGRLWRKAREWRQRYLVAEIGGTATALAVVVLAYGWTHSLATAALAASLGETVGFYAVILRRTVPALYRRHRGHGGLRRLRLTGRAAAVEAFD